MKQKYLLFIFAIFSLLYSAISDAQMVGTDIFLPGRFLEIGQVDYGAWGTGPTDATPGGYFPYPATGGPTSTDSSLASVYDYGFDGWTTGSPAFFGDYTYPGTPFEGWGIQLGTSSYMNYACVGAGGLSGAGSLAGHNISYANTGGQLVANWAGNTSVGTDSLTINMQTILDTDASQVVVTVIFRNISSSTTFDSLFYLRTCDPDNDQTQSGSFATNNTVVYQNDADHRVMVSATGQTYTNAYLALGTKDCRAVAFIYESWPITYYVTDLSTVYWETASITGTYSAGNTDDGDHAIGLIYRIGSMAPGDSAVISYSYIYDGDIGIDSAFPDPVLLVDHTPATNAPVPEPTRDTFNSCADPSLTSIPVSIINATTGDWTWSTWSWAPSTGLATTTGVSNTINVGAIPAYITYTITGTDSAKNGFTCNNKTFYLTIHSCSKTFNNSPCLGDTLKLTNKGDSLSATYSWTGPDGFTSTLQNPFIYPSTFANTGEYYVTKTVAGVDSLDSTYAVINYYPAATLSSNAPLCFGMADTLHLMSAPDSTGETYFWSGPNGFTSTSPNPFIDGFNPTDVGTYQLITEVAGCKDTATIYAGLTAAPAPPAVSDPSPYCQNNTFVPFSVSGLAPGGTALWYHSGTGGVGSSTAPTVNTTIPGVTTYWFSQILGSCEGPRDSISVRVITTPPAPIVTGDTVYCQYIGPFVPLSVGVETGAYPLWYTSSTSDSSSLVEPTVDLSVSGIFYYYASQVDSACESPKTTVSITINPKPAPPALTPPVICQYLTCPVLSATGESGSTLTWYGPGLPASGSPLGPNPSTAVPGIDSYYVTQTVLGCISDSAVDGVITLPQPPKPLTYDTTYCQFAQAAPLNAVGSQLQWSRYTFPIDSTPVPPTNYTGPFTWDVTQSITTLGVTCQSEDTTVTVTILYLPQFSITSSSPFVCQYDSITLNYTGPALFEPTYSWMLPQGAGAVNGTNTTDTIIVVQFDSTDQNNYVYLTASDYTGMCSTTDTIRINVVLPPTANASSKRDICLGDTTSLYLSYESPSATQFTWTIDTIPLSSSTALNVIDSSSNSGGPFHISWIDSGIHIIQLNSFTKEGCPSLLPTFDTVDVHPVPDASFIYKIPNGSLCLEDSVLFIATADNYGYAYTWTPENVFNSIDKSSEWGRLQENKSIITLTVTNPLGCSASTSQELDPGSCCAVFFPSAFTPNGDGKNDKFRPLFTGYHEFHNFRIANRWGQTIFESSNNTAEWDGNYNGVPQDMGTYYYYIKFDCGDNTIEQKGDFTLIR